ncbi:hypothetical protein [Halosimplex sp. J119]
MDSLSDPAALFERQDVPSGELTKSFPDEKFESVRKRYEGLDGVAMVGIGADNQVLLMGKGAWAPLGADVTEGDDWVAATRSGIEKLAGVEIEVDSPELVESVTFSRDGSTDDSLESTVVHFSASLANDVPEFRNDPTVSEELRTSHDVSELPEFAWFGQVPENTHPNHEEHVRVFFE